MSEIRIVIPDKVDRYLDSLVRTGMFSSKAELFRAALMEYLEEISSVAKDYDSKLMFSPEGRIYQLEYAKEASLRGVPVVAITYSSGILFMNPDLSDGDIEYADKIYSNGEIIAAFSGLAADGLYVMSKIRKMKGEMRTLLFELSKIFWEFTTKMGYRPLGASVMVGFKKEKKIAVFDPSGSYHFANYWAIGDGEKDIMEILRGKYRKDMSKEEALKLALNALGNPQKYKFEAL